MASQSGTCNSVKYIAFQFAEHSDKRFHKVHSALNNTYADELEDAIESLLIDDNEALPEIVEDVEALLKRVITDSIVQESDENAETSTISSSIHEATIFAILNS